MLRIRLVLMTLAAAASNAAQAQTPSRFDLTIANIMRGPEHYGREPQNVRWSPDGQWIYFMWLPPGTDWRETPKPYRVRAQAGATPERVGDADWDRIQPLVADGAMSHDGSRKITAVAGDLWLVDLKASTARRLTTTVAAESNPAFSADERRAFFVRDGNAWSIDLTSGETRQLTDIRTGGEAVAAQAGAGGRGGRGGGGRGAPPPVSQGSQAQGGRGRGGNPQRTALEEEQRRLFAVIRDQQRADSIRRAEQRDDPDLPRTVTLGANERVQQVVVSPSGASVLFTTTTPPADQRGTIVPNWVTASGYVEDINGRANVGDVQGTGRMGFMTLPRGEVTWLQPVAGSAESP